VAQFVGRVNFIAGRIVRPEAIEIVRGDAGPLRGTVVSRTFLGEKIEYQVRCEGEMIQIVRFNAGAGDLIPEGTAVSLRFAPDSVIIPSEPGA
jgi:ABC-type Fe3+/spermidine/putrescine transport system ATPase subunit